MRTTARIEIVDRISITVIAVALALLAWSLPLRAAAERLERWLGPAVVIAAAVLAATLAVGLLALGVIAACHRRRARRRHDGGRPTSVGATAALAATALLLGVAAAWALRNESSLRGLFGPPVVAAREAFEAGEGTADFDHGIFDRLLRRHVDDRGLVDYRGLAGDTMILDGYLDRLAAAPFDDLGRDEKLALAINAYNAWTLRLVLEHYPIESIRDIPADRRWLAERWRLAGETWSLDRLEHDLIRRDFREPRIHFALVCAAMSCPRLRRGAYVGDGLEEMLAAQAELVHSHDAWFRFDAAANIVELTAIYDWFASDFEQAAGSVLEYVARHASAIDEALRTGRTLEIRYLPYDWTLNDTAQAR